jgi:disulfide oxidoreductase YuzD
MEHKVKLYLTDKGFLKIKLTKGGKVKITLEVEAKELYKYLESVVSPKKPLKEKVNQYCQMYDNNNGKEVRNNIEEFVSNVYLHKNVKWVGRSLDEGYAIAIDSIVFKNSKDPIFPKFEITGIRGIKSFVEARVIEDLGLLGKTEEYTINCSVYKKGENGKTFSIDPKMMPNN